jgi:hypothetical protein
MNFRAICLLSSLLVLVCCTQVEKKHYSKLKEDEEKDNLFKTLIDNTIDDVFEDMRVPGRNHYNHPPKRLQKKISPKVQSEDSNH